MRAHTLPLFVYRFECSNRNDILTLHTLTVQESAITSMSTILPDATVSQPVDRDAGHAALSSSSAAGPFRSCALMPATFKRV